jgi:acyl carrier protein
MQKLDTIFADLFDESLAEVKLASEFKNLESWDSLKHIQLVTQIEGQFKVDLTAEEILKLTSYQSALTLLQFKGVQA